MSRYIELKYDGKIYTEKYKIDEILIKNKFQWLLDAEIENARLEIFKDTLIWNSGIWYNGIFVYGVIRDIEWRYGIFENGVWYNGTFKNGIFKIGLIYDGKFLNGEILKGKIKGGKFVDIKISKDVIIENEDLKKTFNKNNNIIEKYVNNFDDFLNEDRIHRVGETLYKVKNIDIKNITDKYYRRIYKGGKFKGYIKLKKNLKMKKRYYYYNENDILIYKEKNLSDLLKKIKK